ncbi:MAG: excalibur calcium-binding domain-containing protein [Sporichthyaceae bacterium]
MDIDVDFRLSLIAESGYDYRDSVSPGDRTYRAYKLIDAVDRVTPRGTMEYQCVVTKSYHAYGRIMESVCEMTMDVPRKGKLALKGFGPTGMQDFFRVSVEGGSGTFANSTGDLTVYRSEWTDRDIAGELVGPAPVSKPATTTTFANCKALNKKFPHGVGKKGARDLISGKFVPGKSVTNFKVKGEVYKANKSKDRDKDGVACEKR